MREVVFDEADVKGRSRTGIILEFMEYAYDRLKAEGLFVSADVFGAIINSDVNADSVGQIYGEMAKHLDYISPMIYPSHYADGNYGIAHPDMQPYETICAALMDSRWSISAFVWSVSWVKASKVLFNLLYLSKCFFALSFAES